MSSLSPDFEAFQREGEVRCTGPLGSDRVKFLKGDWLLSDQFEDLKRLAEMRDKGDIDQAEYETEGTTNRRGGRGKRSESCAAIEPSRGNR